MTFDMASAILTEQAVEGDPVRHIVDRQPRAVMSDFVAIRDVIPRMGAFTNRKFLD